MSDPILDEIRALYKRQEYAKIVELSGRDLSNSAAFKRAAYEHYTPGAGDVIISTYPKSGTTWTIQMTYQIGYLGEGNFDHLHQVIPWPDKLVPIKNPAVDDLTHLADSPTGLHVIKGHLEAAYVPYTPEAKYITVVRDPKDMLVSLIHFENSINKLLFGEIVPPNVWVEAFRSDHFIYQSWPMFIDSWWALCDRPNVLILIYEEMQADTRSTIQTIADFVEIALTAEQLNKVVEKSSFAYMKANNHQFDASIRDRGDVPLIREGKTGIAKEFLSPTEQAQVDAYCLRGLADLGSTFPYAEKFKLAHLGNLREPMISPEETYCVCTSSSDERFKLTQNEGIK